MLEDRVDGDVVHLIFQVASLAYILRLRLHFVTFGHRIAVLHLQRRQQIVAEQLLLLDIEVVDDDTDKQVQEE